MDQQLKSNLTSSKHWIRLVYMLLFAFLLYVASMAVGVIVVVQFIFALITGSDNKRLREFGGSLTLFIKDALLFLTFNSEEKPFPFADWPQSSVGDEKSPPTHTASAAAEKSRDSQEVEVTAKNSSEEAIIVPSEAAIVDEVDKPSQTTESAFESAENKDKTL